MLLTNVLPIFTSNVVHGTSNLSVDCSDIVTTGISEIECNALKDLYNSTNGDDWTNNANWGVGNVSDWYGITLSTAGNVQYIVLRVNNLIGTISDSLGNLTNLQQLDLENNLLTGGIPNTFTNLSSLVILKINNNFLNRDNTNSAFSTDSGVNSWLGGVIIKQLQTQGDITSPIISNGSTIPSPVLGSSFNYTFDITENSYAIDSLGAGMAISFTGTTECTQLTATPVTLNSGSISTTISIPSGMASEILNCELQVTDHAGNVGSITLNTFDIGDIRAANITLNDSATLTLEYNSVYTESGAEWTDVIDGSGSILTASSGSVNTGILGLNVLEYWYIDEAGNKSIALVREVTIVDTTAPVISLVGSGTISVEYNTSYSELGASFSDNYDGTGSVVASGSVDVSTLGSYIMTYAYTDTNGNSATTIARTVNVVDNTIPTVTLNGESTVSQEYGSEYLELGYNFDDNYSGTGTLLLASSGSVDVNSVGDYTLTYWYTDSSGNKSLELTRVVSILDTTPPVLSLNGANNIEVEAGEGYSDLGANFTDNVDGTGEVTSSGTVDTSIPGVYIIEYNHTDTNGNIGEKITRTVTVVDTTAPIITLNGNSSSTLRIGDTYVDEQGMYSDAVLGSGTIVGSGSVDTSKAGVYTIVFQMEDIAGNVSIPVTRTITVVDDVDPVITLNGSDDIIISYKDNYTDLGAVRNDNQDGTGSVLGNGVVDVNTLGDYIIYYDYTDSSGNKATQLTRTIHVVDNEKPVITLTGDSRIELSQGENYSEMGALYTDNFDIDGVATITGEVDVNTIGTYTLEYNYTDTSGNISATVVRTVVVTDTQVPLLTLTGDSEVTINQGGTYTEEGAVFTDNVDGTGSAIVSGTINTNIPGSYVLTYTYTDLAGNKASELKRTIKVVDVEKPVINIIGDESISINQGSSYVDSGANYIDNVDGQGIATVSGAVDTQIPGVYILTYSKTDVAGNVADIVTRTVTILDTQLPVITLNGEPEIVVEQGITYIDLGAKYQDNVDGEGTVSTTVSVDVWTEGTYLLTYNYTDVAGNKAEQVIRTVKVKDTINPVISILGETNITIIKGETYIDGGAQFDDNIDGRGGVSSLVSVDTSVEGTYVLTYDYTDVSGNKAIQVSRIVKVVSQNDVSPISNGGGGGGSGKPNCTITQHLECREYSLGTYKYYKKSGAYCRSGNLGEFCNIDKKESSVKDEIINSDKVSTNDTPIEVIDNKEIIESTKDKTEEKNTELNNTELNNTELNNTELNNTELNNTELNNELIIKDEVIAYNNQLKRLSKIYDEEKVFGSGVDILPKLLPKTGVNISTRIGTKDTENLSLDLPESSTFRLAGSTSNDIKTWLKVLPKEDQGGDEYIIIPSNGLVIPINKVTKASTDFNTMISGKEIDVNSYLKGGSLLYPEDTKKEYGAPGNKIIFGHSSYWKNDDGRYKTHFQKIIELEEDEEIWIYKKINGNFKRFKYEVKKSFNTPASNTSVLKGGIGSRITLFTCTPIGGITGRWVIEAIFVNEEKEFLETALYGKHISIKHKEAIDTYVEKIRITDNIEKQEEIARIIKKIYILENKYSKNKISGILSYFKNQLILQTLK